MDNSASTLLYIPDISGFTNFVNKTEINHSRHIISELLEIIIDSDNFGMSVSEIEGDAILFFKEELPSITDLLEQCQDTFIKFHNYLRQYDKECVCKCSACETAIQLSLKFIIHKGDIIHERYAPGIDRMTRTRTWSTAKSIAATLFGMLVDEGRMELDAPLGFEWLPNVISPETDPRNAITLRHVLNMSSGLFPIDSFGLEYSTGSGLSYWAGASSLNGARKRGLVREPGTFWDYENYDTLLAVYAMKQALGDDQTYLEFPRKALLDKIGMRNTYLSVDRFGDFILSSQVYTSARDLARFGLLYLQDGVWDGERLLSHEWIDFVRTPAPSTANRGNHYGGQWWLVPDNRNDVPKDAYSTAGNRGQYVIVVPTHDLVIVRRGLDYGRQGFDRWDLTREVLKAFR